MGAGSQHVGPPDMPRGPVLTTPTPDHSGTVQSRKGGPLWLQLQAYVQPVMFCQDRLRVSTTGVLVTTRTGFPPQVRRLNCMVGDVPTAGAVVVSATNSGG